MNPRLHSCLAVVFAAACSIASAEQGKAIPAPAYSVGDTWTFRVTNSKGKTQSREFSILSVADPSRMLVRTMDGEEYFDAAMNLMPEGNPNYTQVYVQYPMHTGSTWSFTRSSPDPNTSYAGSSEVVDEELVTVPAGTYHCFKVKADWTYSWRSKLTVYRRFVRWYCPEVKYFVKMEVETQTYVAYNPAGNSRAKTLWELVRFAPGPKN